MPAERVSMRRVREILRLKYECGATERVIAQSLGIARSTVAVTLDRLAAAELGWPLSASLSDRVLEAMLYAGLGTQRGSRRKTEPDWTHVHREPRRPGCHADAAVGRIPTAGAGRLRLQPLCELYRGWEGRLSPTMRQAHPAGERVFVDYAGQTVELIDGQRRDPTSPDLRRGDGRLQLHLCRGELDADSARLDWLARARARLHGWRTGAAGARQPEGRDDDLERRHANR
jgi:hypothetical protein